MIKDRRQLQTTPPERTLQTPAADSVPREVHPLPAWTGSPRQRKQGAQIAKWQEPTAPPASIRGALPEGLRSGIETLSGIDMSGVRVHRNSSKPAALQAHAFAQGQNIHLGPGQEKHLPHEAWHVVQQAQGRVRANLQTPAGIGINDSANLELEADRMGAKALQSKAQPEQDLTPSTQRAGPAQLVKVTDIDADDEALWEETVYWVFEGGTISRSRYEAKAKQIFDALPAEQEFEYFEDLADEVRMRLCVQEQLEFPTSRQDEDSGSGGGSGTWLGSLMRLLVGYLVVSSQVQGAMARTTSSSPFFGNLSDSMCALDEMGMAIQSDEIAFGTLQHVRCDPLVEGLCGTLRSNPIYNGTLSEVDRVCSDIQITGPMDKTGACVFTARGDGAGDVSCKVLSSYDDSKIGHELEHAVDSCWMQRNGGSLGRNYWGVVSEIHAHTVQAAIAKNKQAQGVEITARDRSLMNDFDTGCIMPTSTSKLDNVDSGMWAILHIYHRLYVKEDLSLKELQANYGKEMAKARARYSDMTQSSSYVSSRDSRYKKITA